MYTRYSKIALVWAMALYSSMVAFRNLLDYDYWYFVSPDSHGGWRNFDPSFPYHLFFVAIILVEVAIAVLCWWGGVRLFRAREDAELFNQAKGFSIAGLTLGIVLWFTRFTTFGGEWSLMFHSDVIGLYDERQSAFRPVVILGIILLYLVRPDGEKDA